MSIIIHGMDMPTARDTLVLVKTDGTAIVYEDEAYATTAATVPPHGRLIDAEEEMRLMQSYDYDTYDDYSRAFDMLDNAPTIIEAEKDENAEA